MEDKTYRYNRERRTLKQVIEEPGIYQGTSILQQDVDRHNWEKKVAALPEIPADSLGDIEDGKLLKEGVDLILQEVNSHSLKFEPFDKPEFIALPINKETVTGSEEITGFTPGPWKLETVKTSIGSCHKIGSFPKNFQGDKTYACVYADNINIGEEKYSAVGKELLANAKLIASAPTMYAELQSLQQSNKALREVMKQVEEKLRAGIYDQAELAGVYQIVKQSLLLTSK